MSSCTCTRDNCGSPAGIETMDIDGWILQENWLGAYEADRRFLAENGSLPLQEPEAQQLGEYSGARETLAWFAGKTISLPKL